MGPLHLDISLLPVSEVLFSLNKSYFYQHPPIPGTIPTSKTQKPGSPCGRWMNMVKIIKITKEETKSILKDK